MSSKGDGESTEGSMQEFQDKISGFKAFESLDRKKDTN